MKKSTAFCSVCLLLGAVACGWAGEDTYDANYLALQNASTGGKASIHRKSEGAGCECARTTNPSTGGSIATGGVSSVSTDPQVILLNLKPGSKNILCHDTDKATGGSPSICVCETGGSSSTGGNPSTGGTSQTSTDDCYTDELGEVICDIG